MSKYRSLVFDCDGVILDSNRIKTEAFYKTALPFGEAVAERLVDYHKQHGGVSRYKKFDYLLENLIPEKEHKGFTSDELASIFAGFVYTGLLNCDIASGLERLRGFTSYSNWLVVSGGDQSELRRLFRERDISQLYDAGIFGSPDEKASILERKLSDGTISKPALFIGDSKLDYEAATGAGLDFVFVSSWSEVSDWQNWVAKEKIDSIEKICDLEFYLTQG